MMKLDPQTLYSRADLAAMLADCGVDVDHFISRIRARKVFKMIWLGEDILAALRTAPALSDRSECADMPKARNRGNRRGRKASAREIEPGALLTREFLKPREERQ